MISVPEGEKEEKGREGLRGKDEPVEKASDANYRRVVTTLKALAASLQINFGPVMEIPPHVKIQPRPGNLLTALTREEWRAI